MSFFSESANKGLRSRRLANARRSLSQQRRAVTASESPSRYSSKGTPPMSSRRSSSIPPTPVTRFADDDMIDECAPRNKTRNTRHSLKNVTSSPKTSPKGIFDMELHRDDEFSSTDSEINSTHSADRGGGHASEDLLKPADHLSGLNRISTAIRNKSSVRPKNLNLEEKALWDTVQTILNSQKNELSQRSFILERRLQELSKEIESLKAQKRKSENDFDTVTTLPMQDKAEQLICSDSSGLVKELADLQCKYDSEVADSRTQQEEHDRSIRAIQRVLADVNEEKERKIEELESTIEKLILEKQLLEPTRDTSEQSENTDIISLRARAQRAFHLEREMETLKEIQTRIEEERDLLQAEVDRKISQIHILKEELNNNNESKESMLSLEAVQVELREKNASLENAKKLIASLESANGSLATDMRKKLKSKKEEIDILRGEVDDRQKIMGNLATELKNLQTYKVESEKANAKTCKKQQLLAQEVETAIGALQSATVELESSGVRDEAVMERLSIVLGNILTALSNGIEGMKSDNNLGASNHFLQKKETHFDGLEEKLKKKDAHIKALETSLANSKGEMGIMKQKNEALLKTKEQEEINFKKEIRKLRDECQTNMAVLARKEQELQVLRDSLEVGDDVGYISGDESDEDEIPEVNAAASKNASSLYDASRAQALATLLVHSGSGVEIAGSIDRSEIEKLEDELKKVKHDGQSAREELKAEKESLANAKMIISSLEKANKTMLEDLRSRLNDSNSAIAGLLDKSLNNEKAADDAKEKLENLKLEKMKVEEEYKKEIAHLKREIAASIATKSAETDDGRGKSE